MESKINVSLRVKPLSDQDQQNPKNNIWQIINESSLFNNRTQEVFQFDRVFGGDSSTQQIFDLSVKQIVHESLEGINQTIFAYGQTSSGKTFTMKGYDNDF